MKTANFAILLSLRSWRFCGSSERPGGGATKTGGEAARGMGRKKIEKPPAGINRFLNFIRTPANGKFPLAENVYMSISCIGYLPRDTRDAKLLKIFKAKTDIYNVKDNECRESIGVSTADSAARFRGPAAFIFIERPQNRELRRLRYTWTKTGNNRVYLAEGFLCLVVIVFLRFIVLTFLVFFVLRHW